MGKRGLLAIWIVTVLLLAPFGFARAVTLDLGQGIGASGGSVEISMTLRGEGSLVAGTSNDIGYDATLLSNPRARVDSSIGIGTQAGKQVFHNIVKDGLLRVGVFGLNNEAIPDGTVAWVVFDVAKDASAGRVIRLENRPSASDADGNPLAVEGTDGRAYIRSGISGTPALTPSTSTAVPVSITISPPSGQVKNPINLMIKVSEAGSIQNFIDGSFRVFLGGEDVTSFLVDSGTIAVNEEKREATLSVLGLALPDGDYQIDVYLVNSSGYIGHALVEYNVPSD